MNEQDRRVWFQAYLAVLSGRAANSALPGGFATAEATDDAIRAADMAIADHRTHCGRDDCAEDAPWTGHARVELMGHRSYLGRIREIDRYGSRLGEVQELLPDGTYGALHQWGGRSLYNLDPLTEEEALREVRISASKGIGCSACGAFIARADWGDPLFSEPLPICEPCKAAIAVPLPGGAVCARCEKPAVKRDVHADPWCGECQDLPF